MSFGEQKFEQPQADRDKKGEELRGIWRQRKILNGERQMELDEGGDVLHFELVGSIFNKNTGLITPEERKQEEEIVKSLSGVELTKHVFLELDPFDPTLRINIIKGKRGEAAASYHYDDKTGEELFYEINTSAKYSRKPEEKLLKPSK